MPATEPASAATRRAFSASLARKNISTCLAASWNAWDALIQSRDRETRLEFSFPHRDVDAWSLFGTAHINVSHHYTISKIDCSRWRGQGEPWWPGHGCQLSALAWDSTRGTTIKIRWDLQEFWSSRTFRLEEMATKLKKEEVQVNWVGFLLLVKRKERRRKGKGIWRGRGRGKGNNPRRKEHT